MLREMLELLREQRHDFMNHLQVISGLIQLKKYEKAYEYIGRLGAELSASGTVARLNCPEVACAILVGQMEARQRGMTMVHAVETALPGGAACGPAMAGAVREILRTVLELADAGADIWTRISEKRGVFLFQVNFPLARGSGDPVLLNGRKALTNTAAGLGYGLKMRKKGGRMVVTLEVPAPQSER